MENLQQFFFLFLIGTLAGLLLSVRLVVHLLRADDRRGWNYGERMYARRNAPARFIIWLLIGGLLYTLLQYDPPPTDRGPDEASKAAVIESSLSFFPAPQASEAPALLVSHSTSPQPEALPSATYYIQLGAYRDYEQAKRRQAACRDAPGSPQIIRDQNWWKLWVGPFSSQQAAEDYQQAHRIQGFVTYP